MARTHPWEVSDALREQVESLIPPAHSHATDGRPRLPDRQIFAAIVCVVRTGIRWNALPHDFESRSTVHASVQG
jgi:putative transposase